MYAYAQASPSLSDRQATNQRYPGWRSVAASFIAFTNLRIPRRWPGARMSCRISAETWWLKIETPKDPASYVSLVKFSEKIDCGKYIYIYGKFWFGNGWDNFDEPLFI